jgi:hypothetical protein
LGIQVLTLIVLFSISRHLIKIHIDFKAKFNADFADKLMTFIKWKDQFRMITVDGKQTMIRKEEEYY